MYAFIDQSVDSLCNGGRFLLWAMRGWTHAIERGTCPPAALAPGFSGMGLLLALPDFHMALALINKDGLERISVAPMACPRIIEDEAVLLALWRDLASGQIDRARGILELLIEEESVALVEKAMLAAAAKLIAAGFQPLGISTETMKEAK